MHSIIEDWKNGWLGLELALSVEEIDKLIERLQLIKDDSDQHFHISSDYKGSGGLGEITFCRKNADLVDNIFISSQALSTGDEIKK